jgi:hypothetical protein
MCTVGHPAVPDDQILPDGVAFTFCLMAELSAFRKLAIGVRVGPTSSSNQPEPLMKPVSAVRRLNQRPILREFPGSLRDAR